MRYLQFEIEHYKGIKEKATIDLSHLPNSKIFTLVGLNESGKTSLLEAISLLQNDCDIKTAYKMIHVADKGNFNGAIKVAAALSLDKDDEERIGQFCHEELNIVLAKPIEKIKMTKAYRFANSQFQSVDIDWNVPIIYKKPRGKIERDLHDDNPEGWQKVVDYIAERLPRILFYENFLFDFPEKIYLAGSSNERNENNSQYKKIVQDILDSLENGLTIEDHIVKRYNSRSEEDRSALEAVKGDIEMKLTDTIMNSWDNVFTSSGDEIAVDFNDDQDGRGIYLEMKIKQGGSRYSVSERSLGFRWFFSFLLFTQFRKERRDEFGETLFLLDEPASNLHQNSQQNLLKVFETLSKDCKIIYSTHSHYLIDPKNLPGTYIVQNKFADYNDESNYGKKDTDIHVYPYRVFASSYANQSDHFKPILDAIDYIPSDMELVDDIICLEGKNDYYTCKLMSFYVKNVGKLKFYPGGGVANYDNLFRLYLAWGSEFIAVFDADSGALKEKRRYEKDLGPDIQGKIFLLSDVDEAWSGYVMEDLFSENDKLAIVQKYYPEAQNYNKGKFNTALQQLYVSDDTFEFEKETLNNFRKLFKFMKQQLKQMAE